MCLTIAPSSGRNEIQNQFTPVLNNELHLKTLEWFSKIIWLWDAKWWDNLNSQSRDENNRKHQDSFLMSVYQKAHWNVCTSAKYCVKKQNIITIKIPALIADCLWLFWHNITSFNLAKMEPEEQFQHQPAQTGVPVKHLLPPRLREHPFVRMLRGCILIFTTDSSLCFCFPHHVWQAFSLVPFGLLKF